MVASIRQWLYRILGEIPVALFVFVGYGHGITQPDIQRWIEAFSITSLAALLHTISLLSRPEPINRLLLGANLYLLIGGTAVAFNKANFLFWLDHYQETTVFLVISLLGLLTTVAAPSGFIGVKCAERSIVFKYSLWLLLLAILATLVSYELRGDPLLAGFAPFIALVIFQKLMAKRLMGKALRAEPVH
ncbi:MAG: hypothetical protein SV765_12605 [Pseudomonadota bacterium]|nr:hypothetical protein [Pseudomonadales bacterium]MDY6921037.1 hypothetical protein [Pseudomonadota bacterium]